MPVSDPNLGVAFGLVIGAGAATMLGASVVFFPSLVRLASKRTLAVALGLSAGVMAYVSFVEIFWKSATSFIDGGETPERAFCLTSACFFGGVASMMVIDWIVKMLKQGCRCRCGRPRPVSEGPLASEDAAGGGHHPRDEAPEPPRCGPCEGRFPDPAGDLEEWQRAAAEEETRDSSQVKTVASTTDHSLNDAFAIEAGDGKRSSFEGAAGGDRTDIEDGVPSESEKNADASLEEAATRARDDGLCEKRERKKLVGMGINSALAIGIHNFPEGLATFVAALDDPRVGAVLAVAIAIHNIPEGLCVSLPIYYATGNRSRAFLWACVAGASEPLAALLGWAVLANSFSDRLYAIMFGVVPGMMVMISVKDLLPTAHRYDPKGTVATNSFVAGMGIMGLSLVLFYI